MEPWVVIAQPQSQQFCLHDGGQVYVAGPIDGGSAPITFVVCGLEPVPHLLDVFPTAVISGQYVFFSDCDFARIKLAAE